MSVHVPARWPIYPSQVAIGLVLILAVGLARADVKTKPGDKTKKPNAVQIIPEVRDIAVTFVAGKAVDIELAASTGTLKQVEFLIRQQPENGILSAVRSHPREPNKGFVTYTHRGGDAPLADRFSFACRVDGGSVSASAVVTLTGKSFEPKLELVDYIAVDKVFLGDEATVRFTVKNNGAADFAADIPWEVPWQGPSRIEVKSGEIGKYAILFRPQSAGIYRLEKFLQEGVPGSKLPLYGQCIRPLTITPGRLVLTMGSSGGREGELQLVNGQSEPVRVQVQPADRLQGGGSIEVPGGGMARVSLALPPHDVAAYAGEVKVTSPHGNEVVTVVADAKSAELRVVSSTGAAGGTGSATHTALDLGSMSVGKVARGEVTIKNFGGTVAVIQAQARPPLMVSPSGEAVRLEPGAQAVFVLTLTGDQPGLLTRELSFSGDRRLSLIVVRAEVLPAEKRPAPEVAKPQATEPTKAVETASVAETGADQAVPLPLLLSDVSPTPEQQLQMAQMASTGLPVERDRINPFLDRVTGLDLLERTSHSLTVAWKSPSVKPASWIIEFATMVMSKEDGGNFVKAWVPLKNWKMVDGGPGRVAAKIDQLPAAALIELRIMGVDREDKISEPSPGFIMTTDESWRVPAWIWRLSFIVVLALAAHVLNKIRLGEWEWGFRRESGPAAN